MAVQYAPLFALETQFQAKNGRNLTGGFLRVFYAATDDPADTYSDYNLTRNPDRIVLDDNGRALVICDKSKAYRLEVYDAEGMLLWTEEPVYCSGTGGGGVSITRVISTDGSIAIDESVAGSTTTYDIGLAPRDSDEFLEWIKCSEEDCGSTWYPVYQEGTMETEAGQGIKVHKGQLYHFTNTFYVDPDGTGINYDTFKVLMYCGDNIVDSRDFDIDSSLNDAVQCEFSTDVIPEEDSHVYFKLTIPSTCEVTGEVQAHRIYSGVNAVPDTCATKQWIAESYQPLSGMSSYVPYSAVGNNSIGQVTGINGSAIVGSLDSAMVSSIASSVASSYTESAFSSISSWTAEFSSISSKADSSSLSAYQPVSAMSGYATEAYVDAKVGDKLDATASSLFLTGLPDDLATTGDVASAVSGKLDKSASGEFYPMTGNPSGFLTAHQSLAGLATVEYVDSSVSSKLDTSAFASASAGFAPTGDYAYNSSLSAYYPASASGAFQPSGQYQTAGDYALNSAVSSKLDASASSNFVVNSAMSSWIPYSALDYSGTAISGIGGSSLAGMGGGGDYTGIYPVNVDNTAREIAVDSLPLVTDSSMTAYGSAGSSVIGVNMGILSGKLDSSAQVVSATGTQLYAGTTYVTSVNEAPISADRAGRAGNATLATSAYYDTNARFISALPDSAAVSAIASAYTTGKQDTLAFGYDGSGNISSIDGSALAGQGGLITSVDSALDPWYHEAISGLNGSSIYPKWAASAESADYATNASYATNAQSAAAAPTAWASSFITGVSSPSGTIRVLGGTAIESTNSAVLPSTSIDGFSVVGVGAGSTNTTSFTVPESNPTTRVHFGDAYAYGTFTIDTDNSIHRESSLDGSLMDVWFDLPYATSFTATYPWAADVGYTASAEAYEEGGGVGELAWASALPSYSYDGSGNISAINGSAIGGQGGVDSATVSAIASGYVESGVSGKLDASASSDFYSTANPSGFITGVDLSPYQTTADMSGYIPTSMSSDFQQVTGMSSYALSSDVSATVDLVGTQSANWGGSALALSAGPGVKLEKVGDTLVASTDETLLWSGSVDSNTAFATNESPYNFRTLRFVQIPVTDIGASDAFASITPSMSAISVMHTIASIGNWGLCNTLFSLNSTGLSVLSGMNLKYFSYTGTSVSYQTGIAPRIGAIYGINRTAEA